MTPARSMNVRVSQHVRDGGGSLGGRAQHVCMVAIRKHLPAALERAIHGSCDADGESLDPAGERNRVACLDDQVHVVALYREVHEAKPLPLPAGAYRVEDHTAEGAAPQLRRLVPHARRDMHRMPGGEHRPASMRHTRTRFLWSPRSGAISTATTIPKVQ